jgi:hypothetical protein
MRANSESAIASTRAARIAAMGISATQIAASVVLFGVISPLVARRLFARYKSTRPKWLPVVWQLGSALISLVAGVVIAEWWALAIAFLAYSSGRPKAMYEQWTSDDEMPDSIAVLSLAFVAVSLIDLIPVAIGVAIAK